VPNITDFTVQRRDFSPPYKEFRKAIGLTILSYSMGTGGSFPGGMADGAQRCSLNVIL